VDLANPAAPTVAGELEIPGFSNFLYPLPDHHLLATGQDADEFGVPLGVSLQIFDVRDANAPRLAHKYVFEGQGYSAANIDSRNFSFHPDQELVSFPYQDYTTGQSTLEVFHVSTSSGFTRVGGIRPVSAEPTLSDCLVLLGYPQDPYYLEQLSQDPYYSQYLLDQCRYYNQETFRRGVFRDDNVFAISTRRVAAYTLDELEGEPEGEVELPATYPYYGGYGGGAMAGGAGAAGAAGGANMGGAAGVGMAGAAGSASFPEPPPNGAMAGAAGEGGASFD
jgi:Beta propeller domain